MARSTDTIENAASETVALHDLDFLRHLVERALQCFLEAEMTAHIGAARYERSDARQGHRKAIEALHAALPRGEVTVLPGQHHNAMHTAPELFAEAVHRFLRDHRDGEGR